VELLAIDFDGAPPAVFGELSAELLVEALGYEPSYIENPDDLSLVPADGGMVLRQRYSPNERGSPVVEFPVRFEGADEVWLSYRMLFEPGWEWARGGKLPGLAGGTHPTGGRGDGSDGFSARLMFHPDGELSVYAYHADRSGPFGDGFRLCRPVEVDRWIRVTQRVAMNSTAGARDGVVQVWIDDELALSRGGLRWRTGEFRIDVLLYSSFFGGNDASYAPGREVHARFDDFRIIVSSAPDEPPAGG
jgi:hypothetical protein